MYEQELAIVRSLVSVAWADGTYEQAEHDMLEALLEAYHATDAEKASLREYAKERRTLEDIPLQDLSADDRRILLQHAVLLSLADGHQAAEETEFLKALSERLRVPADESEALIKSAEERAKKHLGLL